MKSTYMIATTVLTTLTVLVFVGAFAWSVSPASALASSLAATHSSPDGNHCARLDGKHTELLDAYLRITLELDESARKWLADEGYDPVFGARPLKRVIQRAVQDPLAEMLLAGDVLDGAVVPVSAGPDGLIIGDRVGTSGRQPPEDAVVH